MDLSAYLARVGLSGAQLAPDARSLQTLVSAHVSTIAFENVDVQLGRTIALDIDSLVRKLVTAKRGGYCFEQNGLFAAVLRELGYDLTTLAARVRWMRTGHTPRTHMLCLVSLGGDRWLCDVGFGGFVPTEPLLLVPDVVQETPLGFFRLTQNDAAWTLSARVDAGFSDLYTFTEEPHRTEDYEVMNHYTSTHPESRLKKSLIVSRPKGNARHSLLDTEYVVRRPGETTRRTISKGAIPALLRDVFDLPIPEDVKLAVFCDPP